MRKNLLVLLSLLASVGLVAGACSEDGSSTEADGSETTAADGGEAESTTTVAVGGDADCAAEEVVCIGLVTDVGKIDDKSFNQSAWEGVQGLGSDLDAQIDYIETTDSTDYATNINTFVDQDYDIVVTVGFALAEATNAAAVENPDTFFIGVDQFQAETIDNVAGLVFPEDQAGFLAGALAGLMTESNVVAQVLGTNLVPPVVAFGTGFENGVKYTNADAQVITTYHPGGMDTAFDDPDWGATTARQAIDNGADVVFGAGGKTGNGALAEVARENGDAYCIGVDSDQWETVPEAHPCLVTSAMKLITQGVIDIGDAWSTDEAPSGNFFGAVGLAPYHDFDSVVPDEVKTQIDELTPQVLAGEVETGYTPG
ncbi:MAG: BMP family ABC transporter substrate-binding protein [Acidimicrobiales bacterium]